MVLGLALGGEYWWWTLVWVLCSVYMRITCSRVVRYQSCTETLHGFSMRGFRNYTFDYGSTLLRITFTHCGNPSYCSLKAINCSIQNFPFIFLVYACSDVWSGRVQAVVQRHGAPRHELPLQAVRPVVGSMLCWGLTSPQHFAPTYAQLFYLLSVISIFVWILQLRAHGSRSYGGYKLGDGLAGITNIIWSNGSIQFSAAMSALNRNWHFEYCCALKPFRVAIRKWCRTRDPAHPTQACSTRGMAAGSWHRATTTKRTIGSSSLRWGQVAWGQCLLVLGHSHVS